MIRKLEHRRTEVAGRIRGVFQASYAVEAELLGATDFPPLRRTLQEFMECENDFYAFLTDKEYAGVVEVVPGPKVTHIQSLVVHPVHFRKGIGGALVEHVLTRNSSPVFTVETGLANMPATELYLKFGFRIVGEYDTDHGVRKVQFEKRIP